MIKPSGRSRTLVAMLAFSFLLVALPALPALEYAADETLSGTGIGSTLTTLTIQKTGRESGCVAWNGTTTISGSTACAAYSSLPAALVGGDEKGGSSQVNSYTLAQLNAIGITSASNLRLIFNGNENDGAAQVEDLRLAIFNPNGSVCWDSGALSGGAILFDPITGGTGSSGRAFRIDEAQRAAAQACFSNASNRFAAAALVGADSGPGQTSSGNEVFFFQAFTSADLSITKSDDPDPFTPGSDTNLTYTLTVSNGGPDDVATVNVTDTLPAGVTFVSAIPSQGSCSGTTTVTCNLGAIANGSSATITIVVTPTVTDTVISNTASVSAPNVTDPDPSNNTATEQSTIGAAPVASVDLSITKSDSPDPVGVGKTLVYTLTVDNLGPDDATGVVVTDTLPASASFVSADAPCVHSGPTPGGTVTCSIGSISAAAPAVQYTITVTPTAEGLISNSVSVAGSEPDPDTTNNSALAQTTVAGADLEITKTGSPDPVTAGNPLTYTITVTNPGLSDATSVSTDDTLPAGVTFVSATPSQGSCNPPAAGHVVCSLGTITVGNSATVTIIVTPTVPGEIINTVVVSATEGDPNPTNNTAIRPTLVGAPGTPPPPPVEQIPTLSEWALLALLLLLAGAALSRLKI